MDVEPHLLFLQQESKYLSMHRHTEHHHPPCRNLPDSLCYGLSDQPRTVFTNKQAKRKGKKYSSPFTVYLKYLSSSAKTQVCTLVISQPYYYNLISEPLKTSQVTLKASVGCFFFLLDMKKQGFSNAEFKTIEHIMSFKRCKSASISK